MPGCPWSSGWCVGWAHQVALVSHSTGDPGTSIHSAVATALMQPFIHAHCSPVPSPLPPLRPLPAHSVSEAVPPGEDGASPGVVRTKPLICEPSELPLASVISATMDIRVTGVRFDDHPLFCREDWLASGILSQYGTYCRRLRVRGMCVVCGVWCVGAGAGVGAGAWDVCGCGCG